MKKVLEEYGPIPKEVWEDVNKGKSLVDAYGRYELKELREKVKTHDQNQINIENNNKSKIVQNINTRKSLILNDSTFNILNPQSHERLQGGQRNTE